MVRSLVIFSFSFIFLSTILIGLGFMWYQLMLANSQIQAMEESWRDSVSSAMTAMKYERQLDQNYIEDEKIIIKHPDQCLSHKLPDDIKRLLTNISKSSSG
ncbi:hypothetical protein L3V86_00290 [Thiotrichales bacterium 19S11-10]|nr:hypothetical protein [Thiotrichales bacterium 19S11-10]MCF6808527.1 hypothetical protein [Thiotrichales bacterium 19S9-11]MCF6812497.1 hypothetical protein [Thiotrichales bacterium 19S9-12]